ncbi:TerC family protein [Candidatus Providencia siddallii]|uniref:UPF0053 inner membrane protein YgdQ n=1 Tax=Candidatus Providencia siddallii TaxID=1715285 RepID=A0ABM9NP26_9GAMM
MFNYIFNLKFFLDLFLLTFFEIILSVDNIVFLNITVNKLPAYQQKKVWNIGLILALVVRLIFFISVNWLSNLTIPIFTVLNHLVSIKDLVLSIGGAFLIYKSIKEILYDIKKRKNIKNNYQKKSFFIIIFQIAILDIIFSFDSIMTAIGLCDNLFIMIFAIITAAIFIIFTSKIIDSFIKKYFFIKKLTFLFLILIGINLLLEGMQIYFFKTYVYIIMLFLIIVQLLSNFYIEKH